jgi:hypothetical protein
MAATVWFFLRPLAGELRPGALAKPGPFTTILNDPNSLMPMPELNP